jgi:tRNA(Ile2) C34 agmatinyltransferase TiaS
MNELVIVDCELIRQLRNDGYKLEAEVLILAHQNTIHKNIINGKKQIHLDYMKEKRLEYMKNKLCAICGGVKENIASYRCNKCKVKRRKKIKND